MQPTDPSFAGHLRSHAGGGICLHTEEGTVFAVVPSVKVSARLLLALVDQPIEVRGEWLPDGRLSLHEVRWTAPPPPR